ncbi:alpha-(1,6)-fucosyltransferase-like [Mya arenaria]|uniref:alpha-(1,6)-fucosyltransferase-like n=1 Tax=Mya arenaria TaxID=6604 RepID=UPI0022E5BD3E|nr:alpha-(1,6)-fucosyltransferase-like [Mya arenaria]
MTRVKGIHALLAICGASLVLIICKYEFVNKQSALLIMPTKEPKKNSVSTVTKLDFNSTNMMLHFASQAKRYFVEIAQDMKTTSMQNYMNSTLSDVSALLEVKENMLYTFEEIFPSTQIDLKLQDVVKSSPFSSLRKDRLPINEAIQKELIQRYRDKGFGHFAEFVLKRCEGLKELSANDSGIMETLSNVCKKLLKLQTELARGVLEEKIRHQTGNEWRIKMSRELQSEVQYHLNQYKESPQCNSSRILTCLHVFWTPIGSFIHRTLSCLVAALSSQRALVMDAKDTTFIPTNWGSYMNLKHRHHWPCSISNSMNINNEKDLAKYSSFEELTMPASGNSITNPTEIPNHLAKKLFSFNKHPSAWWIGVMAEYVMLGKDKLSRIFQDAIQTMPFTSPVVGVHVRRTDKIGPEARFHALEEYMINVADWYNAYEAVHGHVERKVYLASDNVEVLFEAEQKYPEYVFMFNKTTTKHSTNVKTRTSKLAMDAIVRDTVLLSRCDFLVCTMSSNICRLAYELMHVQTGDAFDRAVSVDVDWFYYLHLSRIYTAMMPHSYPVHMEISFKVGDVIITNTFKQSQVQEKGFIIGKNRRTGQTGLVPKYKIVEVFIQKQYTHQ